MNDLVIFDVKALASKVYKIQVFAFTSLIR